MVPFFSEIAMAQAAAGAPARPSIIESILPFAVILVAMYFFMIRPQIKRQKDQANLLSALKVGDEVVTSGGIIGRVKSLAESFVTLEISSNASIKVQRSHIVGMPQAKSEAK